MEASENSNDEEFCYLELDAIKRMRAKLGLSGKRAGEIAGFSAPAQRWCSIEAGRFPNPNLSTVFAIAKALKCRPATLLVKRYQVPDDGKIDDDAPR